MGWLRVAVALAILAGLRTGEVRALRVHDVRFDEMVLYIRRTYSAGVIVDTPKGLNEEAVPIVPLLARFLTEAIAGKGPGDAAVAKPNGKPPSEGGASRPSKRVDAASRPCM